MNRVPNKYCNLCGLYHHTPTQPCGEAWFSQALAAASSPAWQWKKGMHFLRDGGSYVLLSDLQPWQPPHVRTRGEPPVWCDWTHGPMIPDMRDAFTRTQVLAVTSSEEGAA